jgi:ParB family chromosome partitioning protein
MECADAKTELTIIPLSAIIPGDNPRKYFCPTAMKELVESIREHGVIQPISLNVVGKGQYKVIAGERRYRAALEVYGQEGSIPAAVSTVSDDKAATLALIENVIRDDMSPTEEAVAAGELLKKNNNDRDETARQLGWHISKLNRRLALLNLVPEVMDALNERRILLGHAELLAAVPQGKQGKALQTVEKMKLTVPQVKELLSKVSSTFETAIFDTTRCSLCQYNSEIQNSLFSESVEKGRCTNQSCYDTKTRVRIEEIREEVAKEVPTVKVMEAGDAAIHISLTIDGAMGVGSAQYEACKACGNFGATVSALPGTEGEVERSVCFDTDCHRKKVTERIKAEKAAAKIGPTSTTPKSSPSPATTPNATDKTPKAKASTLSERVTDYRRKSVWEVAARSELLAQPEKARAFILDLIMSGDAGRTSHLDLTKAFSEIAGGDSYPVCAKSEGFPEKLFVLDSEQQNKVFAVAATTAIGTIEVGRLKKLLTFLDVNLGNHWKVSKDFLSLLTKSEIESVCKGLGLDAALKDFSKVMAGKKEEAIQTILRAEFPFEGAIPSMMDYR